MCCNHIILTFLAHFIIIIIINLIIVNIIVALISVSYDFVLLEKDQLLAM